MVPYQRVNSAINRVPFQKMKVDDISVNFLTGPGISQI